MKIFKKPRLYINHKFLFVGVLSSAIWLIALGLVTSTGALKSTSLAFEPAKEIMSIHYWGVFFVLLGILKILALLFSYRTVWYRIAGVVGGFVILGWALSFGVASVVHDGSGLTGFVTYFYVAMLQFLTVFEPDINPASMK